MSLRMKGLSRPFAALAIGVVVVGCGPSPTPPPVVTTTTSTFVAGQPVADCGGPYGVVQAGREVTFSGLRSTTPNPPLSYNWDFGDNSPKVNGPTPTHTYAQCKPGTAGCFARKAFKVTLTVLDNASRTASCETTCEVSRLY